MILNKFSTSSRGVTGPAYEAPFEGVAEDPRG